MGNFKELIEAKKQAKEPPTGGESSDSEASERIPGRRRMPTNLLDAFSPGWKAPRPWFIPLGDPIQQAKIGKRSVSEDRDHA